MDIRGPHLLLAVIGTVGCSGAINPAPPDPMVAGLAWPAEFNGTPSEVRRLSRDELVASLRMLTGSAPARDDLPEEPRRGHGMLETSGLSFIATEVSKLRQVLAAFASADGIFLSHMAATGSGAAKVSALRIFTTFYANQVALLVDKLKTTNDVHGKPLLDSTLVVWVSELGGNSSNRDPHQTGGTPVVLFGGGQGTLRTGRYLRGKCQEGAYDAKAKNVEAGQDMAKLLVSVIRYMGLTDVDSVGVTGAKGRLDSLHT